MNPKPLARPIHILLLFCMLVITLSGCSLAPAKSTPNGQPTQAVAIPLVQASSTDSATATPADTPLQAAPAPGTYWPTRGWRASPPEDQGMDGETLARMLEAIQEQKLGLHSLLVIRNGYIVSETYFGSYQQDTRHDLYSVTKSFVSTLIGIALDQGAIDSISHQAIDFFPGYTFEALDEKKQAMTLEDVLTMRTGLGWQEGDTAYRALYQSRDWVAYMLDLPMADAPGSTFNYCSGCSHLLVAILQQATGMDPRDFAEQNLFAPLGLEDVDWELNPAGLPIGGWGLRLAPREMAKLGYLFLHHGQWDGQQIVSAGWVENATRSHTGAGDDMGYGYQWWTVPSLGAYTALGLYGQMVMVIPAKDLVIVATAQVDDHGPIFELVEEYILPAVR